MVSSIAPPQRRPFRAELSGYYNRILDFVYLAPTAGSRTAWLRPSMTRRVVRYLRAEARLDVMLRQDFWLNLGFDAVDAAAHPALGGRIGVDWRRGGSNARPEVVLANRQ